MFYSKSTGGFYDPAIHGDAIPADAVEVTETEHKTLMAAQSEGKAITADANGSPVAIDPTTLLTLAQARAQQTAKVRAACALALLSGFTSSALGAERVYGSNHDDQSNLLNAAMASQGQPATWTTRLWCADNVGWSLAAHAAAQVQQVNADWLTFRLSQQQKCADLISQIDEATSVKSALAINW